MNNNNNFLSFLAGASVSFVMAIWIFSSIFTYEIRKIKNEAIVRGYAEYVVVIKKNKPSAVFKWVEQKNVQNKN